MDTIVVYSAQTSNRLSYTLDWLLKERLQLDYHVTGDPQEVARLPFYISYGHIMPHALCIPDEQLLWKQGHDKLTPHTGKWQDVFTLFATDDNAYTIPFDIFSAAFFLLSRYEEYSHPHNDKHGRYPAVSSILYKHNTLMRPVLDEWVAACRTLLRENGVHIPDTHFVYQPTYDVDMAYSHIHKGIGRILGAYMRALLKGDVHQISERTQVLKKKQKDPYDSFRWLRQLHKQYDYKPIYFVLSAMKTTAFDKNIHPQHPAMMRVIKNLAKEGAIGIHPSYYSHHDGVLAKEKHVLEHVAGRHTHISRQHYIRIRMPDTYQMLLNGNITDDYSMGYGSHLGFRAGTGASFLWFDLKGDVPTQLRIHPFCFMDTTAHYEAKYTPAEAFEKLEAMTRILERTGSTLITIFHNFSLGTSAEWKGWRQAYEHFLQEKTAKNKETVHYH